MSTTKNVMSVFFDFFKLFYTKGILSLIYLIIFLLGLGYLLIPGPASIAQFPAVPNSVKSELDGDTVQNPNIAGYFSDYRREDITNYYWNFFKNWSYIGGIKLPVFKINHPPERAYTFIRDQQESTALEEYYVPFRGSFFVNIVDPIIYNQIRRREIDFYSSHVDYEGKFYNTKTTIRYFPTSVFARVGTYLLTIFTIYLFIRLILFYHKKND